MYMGKSDKKVKSNRINAIRKQYDAFLEDDKKRKERNEYILEKLDKMRYCTAMVQVRQKPSMFVNSQKLSLYDMPEQVIDNTKGIHLDIPRKRIDETVLLQEISKKYILIPKLRQPYSDDYNKQIKTNIDVNADWKSKYDILDQLKRDEKEQDIPTRQKASPLEPNQDHVSKLYDNTKESEPLLQYKNEFKLPTDDQVPFELQHYPKDNAEMDDKYIYDTQIVNTIENLNLNQPENSVYDESNMQNNIYEQNNIENTSYDENKYQNTEYGNNNALMTDYEQNNIQDNAYDHNNIGNEVYDHNQLNSTDYDEIPSKDNTDYINTQENNLNTNNFIPNSDAAPVKTSADMYPLSKGQDVEDQEVIPIVTEATIQEQFGFREEDNTNVENTSGILLSQEDTALAQNIDSNEKVHEVNNEMPSENDITSLATNLEYPVETINGQDFTPHDGVQLVDGVNVNPIPEVLVQNNDVIYDPAVVENETANIPGEAFPTEQNGQFYEQTENYDYNTEGVAENYNMEYTADPENYQQNDGYAYYEGTQPEQPYPQINENEETTQRYDQNYEQQYGGTYDQQAYQQGYEQEYAQGYDQQGYVDPQQQYETVGNAQPGLEYENPDTTTQQYVEEQLDKEEGYIENTNEQMEESNVEGPVEMHQAPAAGE